jgi:ribonuclease P protein component
MPQQSLSRVRRDDFSLILEHGKGVQSSVLQLRFVKDGRLGARRSYTPVVSKKVSPLAVDRNRLKRRIRAILQKFEKRMPPGVMLAVFTKKGAGQRTFKELEAEIESLLTKAQLISS